MNPFLRFFDTAPGRVLRARNVALLALALVASECWIACNKKDAAGKGGQESGRSIYMLHCTACHNPNPSLDGSLGPAIQGSALELLQARVLRGEYPPGYMPKRATHIMQALPLTPEEVDSLHAFLNAP